MYENVENILGGAHNLSPWSNDQKTAHNVVVGFDNFI
jgi:hypothetical protein